MDPDPKSTCSTIWRSLPFRTLPMVVVACTVLTYVGFGVLLCLSFTNLDQDGKTPLDLSVEQGHKDLPFILRVSSFQHSVPTTKRCTLEAILNCMLKYNSKSCRLFRIPLPPCNAREPSAVLRASWEGCLYYGRVATPSLSGKLQFKHSNFWEKVQNNHSRWGWPQSALSTDSSLQENLRSKTMPLFSLTTSSLHKQFVQTTSDKS